MIPKGWKIYLWWVLDGSKLLTDENLLFINFPLNFIMFDNHNKIYPKYQITENYISDTINVFYNNDYINSIVAIQAFEASTNIVYQKLDIRPLKYLRLYYNRVLNLEQEKILKDYNQKLNKQNVSAKVSMICATVNYILLK